MVLDYLDRKTFFDQLTIMQLFHIFKLYANIIKEMKRKELKKGIPRLFKLW